MATVEAAAPPRGAAAHQARARTLRRGSLRSGAVPLRRSRSSRPLSSGCRAGSTRYSASPPLRGTQRRRLRLTASSLEGWAGPTSFDGYQEAMRYVEANQGRVGAPRTAPTVPGAVAPCRRYGGSRVWRQGRGFDPRLCPAERRRSSVRSDTPDSRAAAFPRDPATTREPSHRRLLPPKEAERGLRSELGLLSAFGSSRSQRPSSASISS